MVSKVIPVLLLFLLGVWIKHINFISNEGMKALKRWAVGLALPVVLFQTFLYITLEKEYFALAMLMFILFTTLMGVGKLFNYVPKVYNKYNPFMATAFSFGLIGLPLFSIIHGQENVSIFSIIGLAHEFFVWTFYYMALRITSSGGTFLFKEVLNILKSPIIISICLGLILNLLNVPILLKENEFWLGFVETVEYISSTATPIILVTLGYGMEVQPQYLKKSAKLMLIRFISIAVIGIPFKFIVEIFVSPSILFDVSYISFLLLPPMFSLPILIGENASDEDIGIVSTAVSIFTFLSLIVFIIYSFYTVTIL
ncbi:hypothetical protein AN640_08260 [Candidatus Epulonipiscium fishelsonii]|uniref:Uncharacterized protein n=1 Tax=Candidatus Epulonipiscium fishelsonii TaxID=77094 RepID=A0ACC8XE57_9FIRM|nr:hypothetical protein AN640_08260 [Epulopiscium sp. SCG-D08WGA-EpuloA1]OON95509.1 MAG: hypothetical protein ATN32_07080 [Epulopiscium sp. AS2M-Bin002]